jgi:hypothetical protein
MPQVTPRSGKFSWKEVDLDDTVFLADTRTGCSPPVYTQTYPSTARTSFRFYLVLSGHQIGIYTDWYVLIKPLIFTDA